MNLKAISRISVEEGFSLLELLMVLAIVSSLAALAYPMYAQYAVKARRLEARLTLLEIANRIEQTAIENNTHYIALSLAQLGHASQTEKGWYQLTLDEIDTHSYLVSATPRFQDPVCEKLSINHLGEKLSQGTGTAADCWGEN